MPQSDPASNRLHVLVCLAAITSSIRISDTEGLTSRLVVGDVILLVAIAVAIGSRIQRPGVGPVTRWAAGFLAVTVPITVLRYFLSLDEWFSISEMLVSVVKVMFFAVSTDWYLRLLKRSTISLQALRSILLICVITTVIQFAISLGLTSTFLYIEDPTQEWDRFASLPRLYGIFSEPSTAAIFYLAVLYYMVRTKISSVPTLAGFGILLAMTFSLTTGLIGGLLYLGTVLSGRLNARTLMRTVLISGFAALALAQSGFVRDAVQARVIDRLANTSTDQSTIARMTDSWEAAIRFNPPPFPGLGPGQFAQVLWSASPQELMDLDRRLVESGGTWNILANVLTEFGIIGMLFFIVMIQRTVKDTVGRVLIYSLCFASGVLLGWAFWFVLCIAAHVPLDGHQSAQVPRFSSRLRSGPSY